MRKNVTVFVKNKWICIWIFLGLKSPVKKYFILCNKANCNYICRWNNWNLVLYYERLYFQILIVLDIYVILYFVVGVFSIVQFFKVHTKKPPNQIDLSALIKKLWIQLLKTKLYLVYLFQYVFSFSVKWNDEDWITALEKCYI